MKLNHRSFSALTWCLLLAAPWYAPQAAAQFKIAESFTGTTAPNWTISGDAFLTAPSIDTAGSGWLRLTSALGNQVGTARYNGGTFTANQALTVKFRYVAWGGFGADGLSFFLYDAAQNMAGAVAGGGLGYCRGAGGYLGIGVDEFGNFSNPADSGRCDLTPSSGPGFRPDNFVVRGPLSAANPNEFVAGAPVPGGIDEPGATTRPTARVITFSLVPAGVGFNITARYQASDTAPVQVLFSNVSFPYAPPGPLSIGFSGSTGGSTNAHEVQSLSVATSNDVAIAVSGPASVLEGDTINYTITVTNIGPAALTSPNSPTVINNFPAGITGVTWTCAGSAGASCPASGTGNINTDALTLPLGGTVTFTVTGTVSTSPSCAPGGSLVNTGTADFSDTAQYLDPDPSNNTASVTTAVDCLDTTPNAFSFTPVTNAPLSSVQTSNSITVSGTNAAAPISITGGEYSINGGPFTSAPGTVPPGATVVVRQTASGTPGTTTTATLTIGGVSAPFNVTTVAPDTTPNAFSFTPVTGVAPSSVQTSNSITLGGTNAPAPISITGGEYSINGGPFTSAAGTVPPGATVVVRQTASSALNTLTAAVLTIGGVSAPFNVTTRAAQPGVLQFSSPTYTGSGANPSVTVTVTRTGGTDGEVSADVLDDQGRVVGTVTFANGVGGSQNVVIPLTNAAGGATLNLRFGPPRGGATIGTIATAVVTITAAPLEGIVIKSRDGGGSMTPWALLLLGFIIAWSRLCQHRQLARRYASAVALIALVAAGLAAPTAFAGDPQDWGRESRWYVGARAGYSVSEIDEERVTRNLQRLGYSVTATDVENSAPTSSVYVGFDVDAHWSLEAAYTYLGRTYTTLGGTTPRNLEQLFIDATDVTHGAGEAVSLSIVRRFEFTPRFGVDLRGGVYRWKNRTTICFGDSERYRRVENGAGETIGIEPRFQLRENLDLGLAVDYFKSTERNRFLHGALTLEYHF
jgi:uncharacterized repeat protein (TIGR01451 family)